MVGRDKFSFERRIVGAFVTLLSLALALWHPGDRNAFWQGIEGRLLDARFIWRGETKSPPNVAIVTFDDLAVSQLGKFPPPRAALAAAISDISEAGAKVIALDFLLVEPREGDEDLARVLSETDAILAVAEANSGRPLQDLDGGDFSVLVNSAYRNPLPALVPAETLRSETTLGHVIIQHESDGSVRRIDAATPFLTKKGTSWHPSLAVSAVAKAADQSGLQLRTFRTGGLLSVGDTFVQLDRQGAIPLVYYGEAGTIPTFSVAAVNEAELDGKVVFLGASATGFGDRHATPFDSAFPGAELHATLAANIIEQRFLRRDATSWMMDIALALTASVLGFITAGMDRPWFVVVATGALALAIMIVLQAAFNAGWWLDATTVFLSLFLGVGCGGGLRLLQHRRRAANLALYQSPLIVERLASASEPRFEATARPAVVLFVDVEGFTAHSESLGPEGTAEFLRVFHELVEQAVDPLGGIIAYFAGDGAMVVFGLPDPQPNDAIQALRFIDALYAAVRASPKWPGLGLRVGGHSGPVKAGVVGGRRHRQVTVSGDVVNTASRLQDFAKSQKAAIALSNALVEANPETRSWAVNAGMRNTGEHTLRGRHAPIGVWTCPPPVN